MRIGRVQGNPAKRFQARYGSTLRKKVAEIEHEQRALHICPRCSMPRVRRVSTGIWACRRCGYKFAGGAWAPFSKK
ncbi:MAG: 50S ribosomal protein L37ae [Aigarchaeota archaeon]|nr:50S ribosomal protein L37ae [Aigarchaeota archaeon]MCX8193626.1 50S ribosomal protein L37ae [Nitrososphaeria archaeon]MDW7987026.1 50S ribosomal protein L37ae [Nitrososphaerota archaeon]